MTKEEYLELILNKKENKTLKSLKKYNNILIDLDYYINFNKLNDLPFIEQLYCYLYTHIPKCKMCNNRTSFKSFLLGYRKYCTNVQCQRNDIDYMTKLQNTNIEKYGVDNPLKSKEFRNKLQEDYFKKTGYKTPLENKEILSKTKDTLKSKYGIENPRHIENYYEKIKSTNLEKYGYEHHNQNLSVQNKTKNTCIIKYGGISVMHDKEIKQKITKNSINKFKDKLSSDYSFITYNYDTKLVTIKCNKCNLEFESKLSLIHQRIRSNVEICLNCFPYKPLYSSYETELSKVLTKLNIEHIRNYRIENKELDIFIPSYNIGIEINGLYWHSELNKDKDYHINKTIFFENNNILLIHIFEDEWLFKRDIVISMIKSLLKLDQFKVNSRRCEVKEISNEICNEFLNINHLSGQTNSTINLGLFNNDKLLSVMSFSNLEINKYELTRFCNKVDYTVIGAASKLLSWFTKKYSSLKIIGYINRNWNNNNNFYTKIGFSFKRFTDIEYSLTDFHNKYECLQEYNDLNKYNAKLYKIWNCGYIKYKYKINNGL